MRGDARRRHHRWVAAIPADVHPTHTRSRQLLTLLHRPTTTAARVPETELGRPRTRIPTQVVPTDLRSRRALSQRTIPPSGKVGGAATTPRSPRAFRALCRLGAASAVGCRNGLETILPLRLSVRGARRAKLGRRGRRPLTHSARSPRDAGSRKSRFALGQARRGSRGGWGGGGGVVRAGGGVSVEGAPLVCGRPKFGSHAGERTRRFRGCQPPGGPKSRIFSPRVGGVVRRALGRAVVVGSGWGARKRVGEVWLRRWWFWDQGQRAGDDRLLPPLGGINEHSASPAEFRLKTVVRFPSGGGSGRALGKQLMSARKVIFERSRGGWIWGWIWGVGRGRFDDPAGGAVGGGLAIRGPGG